MGIAFAKARGQERRTHLGEAVRAELLRQTGSAEAFQGDMGWGCEVET